MTSSRVIVAALLVMLILSLVTTSIRADVGELRVEWQQFLPGISGTSVIQTLDGGYLVLGRNATLQNEEWEEEQVLIKTDSQGNFIWGKTYRIEGAETTLTRIIQTSDGGYVLAGSRGVNMQHYMYGNTNISQFCLVTIDSQGNIQWTKTFIHGDKETGNRLSSFIQTSDGGYAMVGSYAFPPPTDSHIWFVKADSFGNLEWNKTIGSDSLYLPGGASGVLQTSDGGFVVFGTLVSHGPNPASFKIIKLDSTGNVQWYKTYGGEGDYYHARSYSDIATADGGYVLAGSVASDGGSPQFGWLVKVDAQANMIWNKTYGNYSTIYSVAQTQDSGYVLAGTIAGSYNTPGGMRGWIAKTDEVGNVEGEVTLGMSSRYNIDAPSSVIQANDGGYVFTGTWNGTSNVGYQKFWLVKIGSTIYPSPESTESRLLTVLGAVAVVIVVSVGLAILFKIRFKKKRQTHISDYA